MENSKQLANRLKDVLINGHWIANTNYHELLTDLTLEEASKTIGSHNSIALIIYHVNYYLAGLLDAFATGRLEIKDKYSFEMPTLVTETDWQQLKAEINTNAARFVRAVEAMDSDKLDAPFIEEKYGSFRRNIEAVIEHSYYHMGQIALIKKVIRA